jgi:hypothetical protein
MRKNSFSQWGGAILSLVPPAEAFIGLIKRVVNINKPYQGIHGSSEDVWFNDKAAKILPYTFAFSRTAVLVLTALLVLGFIGALAVPLPGIAPLYGAGVMGIAKACGIAIGYTTAARTIGAFFGAIRDTRVLSNNVERAPATSHSRFSLIMKITMGIGISRFLTKASNFFSSYRDNNPNNQAVSSAVTSTHSTDRQNPTPRNSEQKEDNFVYQLYHSNSKVSPQTESGPESRPRSSHSM